MIGLINFTHSDPLYDAFMRKDLVERLTPKEILTNITEGKLQCGMVSLFEYFRHRDVLSIVESATIHSIKGTMSTLLVSRESGIKDSMEIAITEHTRTTVVYLELILKRMGIDYSFIWSREREAGALLREAEYALVIGDEALRIYGTNMRLLWDIGFQFSNIFTRMPVFSITVRRKDAECTDEISDLDTAIANSSAFVEQCAKRDSVRLGISEEILRRYFRSIRYDFNPQVRKSIDFLLDYYESGSGE